MRLLSTLRTKVQQTPINIFTTRENVMIIQLYPKKGVLSVSYKGKVKTGKFSDNTIRRMLKGGNHFQKDTFSVFGAVVQLIEQIINANK